MENQSSGMQTRFQDAWSELRARVQNCNRCNLCRTRHNIVFGQGSTNTPFVIIGEGPGEDEDMSGQAFVGRAGQLLTKILHSVNIDREKIFITNIVKCRPPNNRNPNAEEMIQCSDFLEAQLLLLRPKIIVTLGNVPTKWLLKTTQGIMSIRGRWQEWRGVQLLPMFHPSFLLRQDSREAGSPKALTWQDIQIVRDRLNEIHADVFFETSAKS